MDYQKFFKDILRTNQAHQSENKEMGPKTKEMEEGLMKGLIEKMPAESRPQLEAFLKNHSAEERMDMLFNIEDFDFVDFFEKFVNDLSRSSDPFSYKGVIIDPKEIKDLYEESKIKFVQYEKSEDINNF